MNLAREHASARRIASTTFRDAFADTLLNLRNDEVTTARIVQHFYVRHEAAITVFTPYVPKGKRESFESAVAQFNDACSDYRSVGVLGLFATELDPQALKRRQKIIASIERLLVFAPPI